MKHQMFSFRFRLPSEYTTDVTNLQLKAGNGEVLAVTSNEYALHFSSLSRFATRDEAQAALDATVKGLDFLGVLIGYGTADFRTFAGDERAPGPPEGLRVQAVLDAHDLRLESTIQLLNLMPPNSGIFKRATEMFDGSCFIQDPAVAVVLRTTGLEILSTRQSADQDCITAIAGLIKCLDEFDVGDSTKEILRNALGREKRESISKAVQRHVLSVVPEAGIEVIRELYAVRSKVVHGEAVERRRIYDAANNAKTLLRYAILRDIGFSMPTAHFSSVP